MKITWIFVQLLHKQRPSLRKIDLTFFYLVYAPSINMEEARFMTYDPWICHAVPTHRHGTAMS